MSQDNSGILMIIDWIENSRNKSHPRFPGILDDVDNGNLGRLAKMYRKSNQVKASHLAKLLNINPAIICLAEKGKYNWNLDMLVHYVGGVKKLKKEQPTTESTKKVVLKFMGDDKAPNDWIVEDYNEATYEDTN